MSQLISRFVVASDLHFMAWKDTDLPVEWVPQIRASLEDIASLEPDWLVINGDLTNGKERDYRLAMRTIEETCPFPVYFTMGNHEYYGYYEDESFSIELARERFLKYTGQQSISYYRDAANARFIFMSTENYSPDLKDAGWISEDRQAWLQALLDGAAKKIAGPIIIFFHQPVNDTVAESQGTFVQSDAITQILRKHERVVWFSGHTHCRMDRPDQIADRGATLFVGGGCVGDKSPQSRFVTLYDDRIDLRIRDHKSRSWLEAYDFTWCF